MIMVNLGQFVYVSLVSSIGHVGRGLSDKGMLAPVFSEYNLTF